MNPGAAATFENASEAKPESAKQKKARLAKEKKAAGAKGADGKKVTVDSVKAQAKKIALAVGSPNDKAAHIDCMNQIRELISETAELCYDGNANVGLDKFDAAGLIILQEELTKFVYTSPEPENKEAKADDLEI